MSPFARPDLFWSTENVALRLRDPKVQLVDCRFSFGAEARADFVKAHLPGAVHIDWSRDIAAPPPASGHPMYMLQSATDFAATMARYGIGDDTFVIGYDAEGGHHAARLWLALRRYGHDRMAVMEGGLQKWLAEARPVEAGEVTPQPASFTARPRDGVVASMDEVLAAVRTGQPWLLDVRRPSEYSGEESRAKHGGHVPGAVNVLWKDAVREDWMLKDPEELEQLYIDAGFGPETKTITYCQAGVRAAFTHLVLTALGHDDVRTYDGSWEEWGNRDDVPIVTGRS
ncbi:MAG: sulfurtransferase [Chloroflexota bacterium]|nr:sulfurtransferase [Chloroflexota bacterium]